MRKWLVCLIAVTLGVALLPHTVWAHELITDSTNQVGLVLHVEPDDDPTAGTASELEFIMQNGVVSSATLRIDSVVVPVTLSDNSIIAKYPFPVQGTYRLQLDVSEAHNARLYHFTHSLQVSRGVTTTVATRPAHVWAGVGLAGSILALLTLGFLGWRQRRLIAQYSRH